MKLLIQRSSVTPIYEQICMQIRSMIMNQEMKPNELLPSVRSVSKDYKISALTVKKAYDLLEQEGLIVTVQGKGSFIKEIPANTLHEEAVLKIEEEMSHCIEKAKMSGLKDEDILEMVRFILEEYHD